MGMETRLLELTTQMRCVCASSWSRRLLISMMKHIVIRGVSVVLMDPLDIYQRDFFFTFFQPEFGSTKLVNVSCSGDQYLHTMSGCDF
jgi:hypothetical protein